MSTSPRIDSLVLSPEVLASSRHVSRPTDADASLKGRVVQGKPGGNAKINTGQQQSNIAPAPSQDAGVRNGVASHASTTSLPQTVNDTHLQPNLLPSTLYHMHSSNSSESNVHSLEAPPEEHSSNPEAATSAAPSSASPSLTTPLNAMNPSHKQSPIQTNSAALSASCDALTFPSRWNHVDSSRVTSLPSGHHLETPATSTCGVSRQTMPPLTSEQQQATQISHQKEESASDLESRAARKRDFSARSRENSSEEGLQGHGTLPFGLRNKKMKPTDCLLFAATLLSKEEDSGNSSTRKSRESARSCGVPPRVRSEATDAIVSPYEAVNGDDLMKPRDVDVLCGRGGLINKHFGNVVYRKVVDFNKPFYQSVHKKHRILVSQSIVQSILNCGGRFLIMRAKGKAWIELGYKRAVQKTSQALRERSSPQENEGKRMKTDDDSNCDENGKGIPFQGEHFVKV